MTAPLAPADRLMLDYVVQLTRDATRTSSDNHEALRAAGFDDRYPANDFDCLLVQLHQPLGRCPGCGQRLTSQDGERLTSQALGVVRTKTQLEEKET